MLAQKDVETKIIFVGDILLSRNVTAEYQHRSQKSNNSPWVDLKPLFKTANLVVGNLEGAIGEVDAQSTTTNPSPIFDIPNDEIFLLREAGFNALSIENNHSLDLGKVGKQRTIDTLTAQGITPLYNNNSPQFVTINNTVIALIAINLVPSRDYSKSQIPSIEIEQKLRFAKSLANLTIVTIHWGSELLSWPNQQQRQAAKWLIANGADLIIGSHPHVVQQPEIVDGKPVFFSLGNHLFDQKYPATKEGLIAEITIKDGHFQCGGFKTHTKPSSFYPQITDTVSYNFPAFALKLGNLKINQYTLKPLSVKGKGDGKTILQAYCNNKKMWSTHAMALVTLAACKLDSTNEYLFALENHFSSLDSLTTIRPYIYSTDERGIYARWRGSALAFPLLDAQMSATNPTTLCALHRGDSFLRPQPNCTTTRTVAYKWNGFGFSGMADSISCKECEVYRTH